VPHAKLGAECIQPKLSCVLLHRLAFLPKVVQTCLCILFLIFCLEVLPELCDKVIPIIVEDRFAFIEVGLIVGSPECYNPFHKGEGCDDPSGLLGPSQPHCVQS
jgi:hypothetical protein